MKNFDVLAGRAVTTSQELMMVFGSINEDKVLEVQEFPAPGQTVLADNSDTCIGGKGANQAIAAALHGTETLMVGAVGDDSSGETARKVLEDSRVQTTLLESVDNTPTGTAYIYVRGDGENTIVVDRGANIKARGDSLERYAGKNPAWILMSLEVPEDQAMLFARHAKSTGSKVAINASPRLETPIDPSVIDALIVNESEIELIAGPGWVDSKNIADSLSIEAVIITQGARGTRVDIAGSASFHVDAIKVHPVDTTGCGDAFAGVLIGELCSGSSYADAVHVATVYAGHVAEFPGASTSYPQAFAKAASKDNIA